MKKEQKIITLDILEFIGFSSVKYFWPQREPTVNEI